MRVTIPVSMYKALSVSLKPGEVISLSHLIDLGGISKEQCARLVGNLVMLGVLDVTPGAHFSRWAVLKDVFQREPKALQAILRDPKVEADKQVMDARLHRVYAALKASPVKISILARETGIPAQAIYAWSYHRRGGFLTRERYDTIMRALAMHRAESARETHLIRQCQETTQHGLSPARKAWKDHTQRPFLQALLKRVEAEDSAVEDLDAEDPEAGPDADG